MKITDSSHKLHFFWSLDIYENDPWLTFSCINSQTVVGSVFLIFQVHMHCLFVMKAWAEKHTSSTTDCSRPETRRCIIYQTRNTFTPSSMLYSTTNVKYYHTLTFDWIYHFIWQIMIVFLMYCCGKALCPHTRSNFKRWFLCSKLLLLACSLITH